ncbi:MAG: hypothetical protein GY946_32250 [bacterium]|nr:hypothetical protein [bacterium]
MTADAYCSIYYSMQSRRPKAIKAVFLLTMFKIVLAWTFYAVFSMLGSGPVDPSIILYTASAYVVLAVPTFVFIHRRNALGVRICIGLAIVASLPARAGIGILIDVIAMVLTFRKPSKAFFGG